MHLTLADTSSAGGCDPKAAALEELERILASEEFAKAERMRRFLRYAVERTLADDIERLKETVIGLEVFDRPASYDPKADPIVRIEARRLREKLKHYYDREGGSHSVRIDLPKGGYVASIVFSAAEAPVPASTAVETVAVVPTTEAGARNRTLWRWASLAAAMCIVLAGLLVWALAKNRPAAALLDVRTFTSLPGAETDPSISPDGTKVAYVWTGGEHGEPDLYVQAVDSFTPVRLTHAGGVSSPVWSPDGQSIAFLHATGPKKFRIMIVEPATRALRQSAEVESDPYPIGLAIQLDWSPDGKYFVTTHRRNLVLIPTGGGEMRQLTTAPDRALGDYDAAFSPDGQRVAFRRAFSFGVADICVVPVDGARPVLRVTYQNQSIGGHTWTADGRSLVFSVNHHLWRVDSRGGEPVRITDGTVKSFRPKISRAGGRLVFASPTSRSRIWRMPLDRSGPPVQVLSSTVSDASPDLSPDGKRIAFRSDRSGSDEIWLAKSDGSNPVRLTRFEGPLTGCPRWSPDGRQLVLDSRPDGKSDIFIVTVADGAVRRFTQDPADEVVPSWSRDGRFVYFASNRTGSWQVWKQPVSGGSAVQVTKEGGFAPWESQDGRSVYYAKSRSDYGLWRVALNGGVEEAVVPELEPGMWGNWQIGPSEIYFAETSAPFRVRAVNRETRKHREVGRLKLEPMSGDAGMALSSDGKWLYLALAEPLASDLYVIEQFQ